MVEWSGVHAARIGSLPSFPDARAVELRRMILKTLQQAKRLIKIVFGFTILLAGIVMLVTPGPGWPTIFAGLAVLAAAEIVWARRLLNHLKAHGVRLRDAVFSSNGPKNPPNLPSDSPK
ncbi:MAG: PGPGW domain-containing protein [Acidobacteria bacterium]|nr:PGPGW domain-containing protein [Acidobacteriota bacterium]